MAKQRTITAEDLAANPMIAELDGVVGDILSVVHEEPIVEEAPAEEPAQ